MSIPTIHCIAAFKKQVFPIFSNPALLDLRSVGTLLSFYIPNELIKELTPLFSFNNALQISWCLTLADLHLVEQYLTVWHSQRIDGSADEHTTHLEEELSYCFVQCKIGDLVNSKTSNYFGSISIYCIVEISLNSMQG